MEIPEHARKDVIDWFRLMASEMKEEHGVVFSPEIVTTIGDAVEKAAVLGNWTYTRPHQWEFPDLIPVKADLASLMDIDEYPYCLVPTLVVTAGFRS